MTPLDHPPRVTLARVNYSQLYTFYDSGKTHVARDILTPYQLLSIAGHLEAKGIEVALVDGELELLGEEALSARILATEPDVVGLTATTPDIVQTIHTARLVKAARPEVVTVIGGPHATAAPDELIDEPSVDWVVREDGELALDAILAHALGVGEVPPMATVSGAVVTSRLPSLDEQPLPSHHLVDYGRYMFTDPVRGRLRTASILSARGCPFMCQFCFHDRRVRFRPPEVFLEELRVLTEIHGVEYFYVYDDTFLIDRPRVLGILSAIARWRPETVHLQCLTRANLVDEELVAALVEAGFVRVSMGIESGSARILRAVSKGVSKDDYRRACSLLHDAGIETRGSFIVGHPFETMDTVMETIAFAKELELYHANFNLMTPYPGTVTYELALGGQGLRFKEPSLATDWSTYRRWGEAIVVTDELDAATLEELRARAHVEFYTQPKVYQYYKDLFERGNRSSYFFRPLDHAWRQAYGVDVPFWGALDDVSLTAVDG